MREPVSRGIVRTGSAPYLMASPPNLSDLINCAMAFHNDGLEAKGRVVKHQSPWARQAKRDAHAACFVMRENGAGNAGSVD